MGKLSVMKKLIAALAVMLLAGVGALACDGGGGGGAGGGGGGGGGSAGAGGASGGGSDGDGARDFTPPMPPASFKIEGPVREMAPDPQYEFNVP